MDGASASTEADGPTEPALCAERTIARAYRVRLAPKPAEARKLSRLFGARRYVWNWALRRKDDAWKLEGSLLTGVALSREFTALRAAPDTAWLGTLPREPFNQTLRDFDAAWKRFFAGQAKRPRRRRYGTVNSARFTLDQRRIGLVRLQGKLGSVQIDGVGRIRFRVTEAMPGRLRSVTVSRDGAGRWYASFTADGVEAPKTERAPNRVVGIDLGLKSTAVFSTGEVHDASKPMAAKLKRLRRYQRRYSRQMRAAMARQGLDLTKRIPKGTKLNVSNRMRRQQQRIARLHVTIGDIRRNHLHQVSARAVATAEVICLETLNVAAMGRSMGRKAFRRGVADAALGELRRQVAYKAEWHGRVVSLVDRFYPSSKTCSACGEVNGALKLKDRTWACPACGAEHDRDENAATNIEREGLRLLAGQSAQADGTRRSRGTNARGVDACAAGKSPSAGQPITLNRELAYRAAQPRTTRQRRDGPERRVEG